MIQPILMCRKHLLGEHGEIHKHRHNFVKHHSITKRVKLGQIAPAAMQNRHDALVVEMLNRGYKHNSPYEQPDISYLPIEYQLSTVNAEQSLLELVKRCPQCAERVARGSM